MFLASCWSVSRKSFLPLIEITGKISPEATGVPLELTEVTMIKIAISIIEKANDFDGVLCGCDDYPNPPIDSSLSVSFSLFFSSEQQLSKFMKKMFEKPPNSWESS